MRSLAIGMLGAMVLAGCGTEGGRGAGAPAPAPVPVPVPAPAPAPVPDAAPVPVPETPAGTGAGDRHAKPGAPVDIAVQLGASAAAVEVRFRGDASDVSVEVWGADGLAVQSDARPIAGRSFRGGERVQLQVGYAAAGGAGTLAVRVSGAFGARRLSRVQSFTVGGAVGGERKAPGELTRDGSGRRVRVMKPQ